MRWFIVVIGLLAGGCTATACQRMVEAELYFGLTDENAFGAFLDREVTPRFPAGLTVVDAAGRWRDPAGHMTQERSKLVVIVIRPDKDIMERLQAIRNAYKAQFSQQSVGMVLEPVCADF